MYWILNTLIYPISIGGQAAHQKYKYACVYNRVQHTISSIIIWAGG